MTRSGVGRGVACAWLNRVFKVVDVEVVLVVRHRKYKAVSHRNSCDAGE